MSLTAASHSLSELILLAGAISGSIDLFAALTFAATRGTPPKRVLQAISSAMIGPDAFSRSSTVPLGLGLHYLIAFTVASTYVVASRYIAMLTEHPVLSGILFGVAVHLVMTFVVLPLSALKRPFSMTFFLGQLMIHMFCVGLPTALVVKHFS